MVNLRKQLSIIVYSCYRNKDMWAAFSFFYKKYHVANSCKIVLATDRYEKKDEYIFDDVVVLDSSWADMIKMAVTKCDTPYVMLFMDDYLLSDSVDDRFLEKTVDDMKKYHAQNIRLKKSPFSKKRDFAYDDNYYEIILGNAYCFVTQVGVWESSFLLDFLSDGLSAWEFERECSMECGNADYLILEHKYLEYPYIEAVRKGKWMRCGIKHCNNNGYYIDYSIRKKTTILEELEMRLKKIILRLFPNVVQTLQNMF